MKARPDRGLWSWWFVFFAFVALVFLLAVKVGHFQIGLTPSEPGFYRVREVLDGDTIIVDMNGRDETVRLIGVDTPETHRPNTPVQCYGPEASNFTKQLIRQYYVRLQADPLETNRDRYDRLLRYVYLPDNTLIEEKLISEGYGFSYTQFPFSKSEGFDQLEVAAKQAGKGLWSACKVIIDSSGREQTNSLE